MPAPFLSSEEYDERAHRQYDSGDYDAALDTLKEGLQLYPSSVDLHVGMGYTRLAREEFVLESDVRGPWQSLYRFDLREQHLVDYEVANWYVSTHPASHFLNALLAARPAAGRRYGLWDNELSIHTMGSPTEKRLITNAGELRGVLTDLFRLTLPAVPALDAILARMAAKPAPVSR